MRRPAVLVLALLLGLAGCGSNSDDADTSAPRKASLRVLAASSLTESFTALEKVYEAAHPDVDVKLSFDSSAILVEQLSQGLKADVLATADTRTMDKAVDVGVISGTPATFATNTLVIATPQGNPAEITSLDDLAGSTFAVCVPAAPCGDAAKRLFALDGFTGRPTTEEENVKGVLTKVTTGEVDAGLVYASDAKAAGDKVEVVQAENASEVVNIDPVAAVEGGEAEAARDWIDLLTGAEGQKVLASFGFGPRD